MATCEVCGQRIVPASGPVDSDVLLVGEFPGRDELDRGVPFVGEAGRILEYELFLVGLNMRDFRLANLWQHPKPDKMNEISQQCFDRFVVDLIKEMRGRKVLLMGSENANTFLRWKISDCSGLLVESPLFPKDVVFVQACVNPAAALHENVGELRNGIQKFYNRLGKE